MANLEMTPKQQWSEQVRKAKNILILTHQDPDGDALGSALGLKLVLEKLGKKVTLAIEGAIPETYNFLSSFSEIENNLVIQRDLLVMIDESQAKIGNVGLKRLSENKLMVVITPKEGILTTANIHIEEGTFMTDLIIVLDSANLERLGKIYGENPNIFYETPIVNIDHHSGNTNFGRINIIDITASSTSEILLSLIETLNKDFPTPLLEAEIATCLLTGLIDDTGSFQNSNTTPKSLTVAAQLVAAGAKQQEIIKRLYKTRNLSTLRLWGRALSYIKEDAVLHFAWSVLTKSDFVASQAKTEESDGIIDELLKTASGMDFVLLMTEQSQEIHASLRSTNPSVDVSKIASEFGGGGHPQAAAFRIPGSQLAEKELEIINTIRNFLNNNSRQVAPAPKSNPLFSKSVSSIAS
jgi:phosphoesterase RecJ-like protein